MRSRRTLTTAREMTYVLSRGRPYRTDAVTVYVARRDDRSQPGRLGLVVGARCGPAVTRNRIKRRIRAAWVQCERPGLDVVVRAGPGASSVSFQELVKAINRALSRPEWAA